MSYALAILITSSGSSSHSSSDRVMMAPDFRANFGHLLLILAKDIFCCQQKKSFAASERNYTKQHTFLVLADCFF